jgi:hypothetical protein
MVMDPERSDVQLNALAGANAVGAAYSISASRLALTGGQTRSAAISTPEDSSAISHEAADIARFAQSMPQLETSDETAWAKKLENLQQAMTANALPIDSVALAHAILRDENFPQGF